MSRQTANAPGRSSMLSIFSAVITAVASSACCWLPLLLLGFGASAAGLSAFFERWRPLLVVVSVLLLTISFWQVYFRSSPCKNGVCSDDTCASGSKHHAVFPQVMLWVSTAFVASFVLFPQYASVVAETLYGNEQNKPISGIAARSTAVFDIKGMSCEACAIALRTDLMKIDSVTSVEVDYSTKSAIVKSLSPDVEEQVKVVAEHHGYIAVPLEHED